MPDQVMQSLFGARDAARSRGDKMTAAFERMAAIKQEREQIAKQEAAQRLQFMEQIANQKTWWRDTDEQTRNSFFDQMDQQYEMLGLPAGSRGDRRVDFFAKDFQQIMEDAYDGKGVVEVDGIDPETGVKTTQVRLSPLVIAKLESEYGPWVKSQILDMGNQLLAQQTLHPPVTEAPGVDTAKAKTVQGKESMVMDNGAALPQPQRLGRWEDSLNEMLQHAMNSPERREKIAKDAAVAIDEILDYVSQRGGQIKSDDKWLTDSVNAVNTMRARIGLGPLEKQWYIDSWQSQAAPTDADRFKFFVSTDPPEGQDWSPAAIAERDRLAQSLGYMPKVTSQNYPQEVVGETTSEGTATKPSATQSAGLFVPKDQMLDPNKAASSIHLDYNRLASMIAIGAGQDEIAGIVGVINAKHKAITGKDLTPEELQFNLENMTAYQSGQLKVAKQNADTSQQRANDTKTYQTGMLGVAKQNANTAEKRATAYVNNFQADKTKATGTALLSYYNSLKSRKAAMLKGGLYSPTSQVIQEIDAEIAEMEPIIREAKGLAGGSGTGKTWSTSKYDAELSPDLKAAAQSGIAAGKVGPALRAELKARGLPDALVQSEYVRLMKQFYDPYKRK